jgi:hypothetical protein
MALVDSWIVRLLRSAAFAQKPSRQGLMGVVIVFRPWIHWAPSLLVDNARFQVFKREVRVPLRVCVGQRHYWRATPTHDPVAGVPFVDTSARLPNNGQQLTPLWVNGVRCNLESSAKAFQSRHVHRRESEFVFAEAIKAHTCEY